MLPVHTAKSRAIVNQKNILDKYPALPTKIRGSSMAKLAFAALVVGAIAFDVAVHSVGLSNVAKFFTNNVGAMPVWGLVAIGVSTVAAAAGIYVKIHNDHVEIDRNNPEKKQKAKRREELIDSRQFKRLKRLARQDKKTAGFGDVVLDEDQGNMSKIVIYMEKEKLTVQKFVEHLGYQDDVPRDIKNAILAAPRANLPTKLGNWADSEPEIQREGYQEINCIVDGKENQNLREISNYMASEHMSLNKLFDALWYGSEVPKNVREAIKNTPIDKLPVLLRDWAADYAEGADFA